VIGEQFAWAHLPKTAGTATAAMFGVFDDLLISIDSPEGADAHITFRERERQIAGKRLVMNIRRLPAWVASRANYVSRHGVHPDFEPIPVPSADELADSSLPDERLALFTDGGRFAIDHWLRAESLADDLLGFVAELRTVTDSERVRVRAVGPVRALDYERDVSRWFTPAQVERLYQRNPAWAALEARLYPELVPVA
jgi:hypothetical protein